MDGRSVPTNKRRLVAIGGDAVKPILEAITGSQGRLHPDHLDAVEDLFKVLSEIARRDVTPLALALADGTESFNAVVWAVGHSRTRHAAAILESLADHDDGGVRAVVKYHTSRRRRRPRRVAKKKATKRKAAKKKAKKRARRKAARKR